MINFNKKDPVADAVKQILEKDLSPKQKKIAKMAGDPDKIDAQDLAALRSGKKPTSEETVEENAFDYTSPRKPEPNGGSGVKKGTRYGGSKQKDKPEHDEDKMKKEEIEELDEISVETMKSAQIGLKNKAFNAHMDDNKRAARDYAIRALNMTNKIKKKERQITKEEVEELDEDKYDDMLDAMLKGKSGKRLLKKNDAEIKRNKDINSGKALDKHIKKNPGVLKTYSNAVKRDKKMYGEEIEVNVRTKDTIAGRIKTKQKDDVGPGSDGVPSKVRFHAGPKNEEYVSEDEKTLAANGAVIKTEKPLPIDKNSLKTKTLKGFKEEFNEDIYDDLINEVLSKDASAGDWIHDFVHSDNPKFKGKTKAERKKMALGAYYAKKNEEYVEEGMKDALKNLGKKTFKALTGGSDKDQRKDLQRKMGVPQTGKKPTSEEVVMEGRSPVSSQGMDTPFVTDMENKPLNNAKQLASKTMKRIKNEMLGKPGTSE